MTIRIIDESPSPKVLIRSVCRNCGVTLEFTPADTYTRMDYDYGGSHDLNRYISCPKCKCECQLP
jgi:hypothetical protein